jgi:hypothetical protein
MPARNGKTLKRKSEAPATKQQEPQAKKQATSTPATEIAVENTNGSKETMAEEIPQRFETLQLHAGYVNCSLTSVVGAPYVGA